MEPTALPVSVAQVVTAVQASGQKLTVTAVCRTVVVALGLSSSPATRALVLAAVDALGLPAPTDKTLRDRLMPGVHTASGQAKRRAISIRASRKNRLTKLIGACRGSSKQRGHGKVDEIHLRTLWQAAEVGETPWHGLLDFGAHGVAEETGSAGGPWAPSFDRLDNDLGYVDGNVVLVPNIWNRTCNRFDRKIVLDLAAQAAQLYAEGRRQACNVDALRSARPFRSKLEAHLARPGANVFKVHPALLPHREEMMDCTLEALYGAGAGVCPVTGLAFSAEPGHPCFPSWDLVDHRLTGQRAWREGRRASTEGGRERPSDMRLVCQFFNLGRCTFDDADWWTMADRVRELVDAGVST